MEEIVYIEETESFSILKEYIFEKMPSTIVRSIITMALDLLKQILYRMYSVTDYGILVKRASSNLEECQIFSLTMSQALKDAKWAKSTCKNVVSVLRRVMLLTGISPEFPKKIQWMQSKPKDKFSEELPSKIDDVKRKIYSEWAIIIKEKTNNKSPNSIKGIISFYQRIIDKIGISDISNSASFNCVVMGAPG
jgi:hypothetical protein